MQMFTHWPIGSCKLVECGRKWWKGFISPRERFLFWLVSAGLTDLAMQQSDFWTLDFSVNLQAVVNWAGLMARDYVPQWESTESSPACVSKLCNCIVNISTVCLARCYNELKQGTKVSVEQIVTKMTCLRLNRTEKEEKPLFYLHSPQWSTTNQQWG